MKYVIIFIVSIVSTPALAHHTISADLSSSNGVLVGLAVIAVAGFIAFLNDGKA